MAKLWTCRSSSTEVSPTLYVDGNPITNYTIKGRSLQNNTPTESNPVEVLGVGILGKNLYNFRAGAYQTGARYISDGQVEDNANYSIWTIGVSTLNSGTYTFSLNSASTSTTTLRVVGFKNDVKVAVIAAAQLVNMPLSITVTDDYDEIRFSVASGYVDRIMLNAGATALPYEPYGYYLPVSSGGVVMNIPIGTVQTTRKIKKYEFTGQETLYSVTETLDTQGLYCFIYQYASLGMTDIIYNDSYMAAIPYPSFISSHFINKSSDKRASFKNISVGEIGANSVTSGVQNSFLVMCVSGITSEAGFKQWLADQYAAGTPVTVWYILAEPTTGTVNESLMKIGEYADSITGTQSQVSIPTTAGENSITFLTDIQPSRFELPIEGWYFDNPKKWDGSQWV